MVATQIMQKVQLVESEFTALEASDILKSLIHESINFNKKRRLKLLIGNENCDTSELSNNIQDLSYERRSAKEIITEARRAGLKVTVKAHLEISIEH